MKPFFGLGIFLALCSIARADIVFIDTDFAESEVNAAKAAAAARPTPEKVIAIPSDVIPDSDRPRVRKIQALERDYHERLVAQSEGKPFVSKPTDAQLLSDLENIRTMYGFSPSALLQRLTDLKNADITTVIFSGHSDGVVLQGMLYEDDIPSIADLRDSLENAGALSALESVYLWGCYTLTAGRALDWHAWKAAHLLSDSFSVFGWDTRSLSTQAPADGQILKTVMTEESQLRALTDKQQILSELQAIPGVNRYLGLSALIGETYISTDQNMASSLSDLPKGCLNQISYLLGKERSQYSAYADFTVDLPSSEDDASGLRSFYNQLQKASNCLPHCESDQARIDPAVLLELKEARLDESALPCPPDVIKLIDYEITFHNFLRFFSRQIGVEDQTLTAYPVLQKKFEDLFVQPQSDQLRAIEQLQGDLINTASFDPSMPKAVVDRIKDFTDTVEILLYRRDCIPFSWILDQETPEAPTCENSIGE